MNRRKRVLIVEDDGMIAQLCRQLLERTGDFLVGTEEAGLRAVATARHFQPDVILLDLHLPDRDGRDIACDLGADEALSGVPIGFITGAAEEVGGDAPVMSKPFCGRQLVDFARRMAAMGRPAR